MPDPGPVVIIGLQQIYEAVVRLEGTVTTLVAQHSEQGKDLADHEARLRVLERGRWPLPTVTALISLISLGLAVVVYLTR